MRKTPEEKRAYDRLWYARNRERKLATNAKWRAENQDKVKGYRYERSEEYKERNSYANRKDYRNQWQKEKREKCPIFATKARLRARIHQALSSRGYSKESSTAEILGCDNLTLKRHIEKQFVKGMNWNNRELWHIDHIVPLSSASSEDEIIALCHFSNLRPIWAQENLAKSASIVDCQPELKLDIR